MLKRIVSIFLLTCILFTVPVWAQEREAQGIPYIVAVRGATRNLPAVTVFDDRVTDIQEARQRLQDLLRARRATSTMSNSERIQMERQIADLGAEVNTMRALQDMARTSVEFAMRNSMTTIANTQLDILLLEAVIEQDRITLNNTRLRLNAGLISESDMRAAELAFQQQEYNLAALEVSLETERQSLNRILQRPITGNYYVTHDRELLELPRDLEQHIRRVARRQPNVRRYEIIMNRARAAFRDQDVEIGSPERRARERAYNQAVREHNETLRGVETAMRNQYNSLILLMHQNESLGIDLQRATERLQAVVLNYQAGLATPFDIEAAELAILRIETAIERNLNTYWNAQFMFENPFLLVQQI